MSLNRPNLFPDFALLDLADPTSLQNNVVEPPQVFKDFGWHPFRMKPPRGWMNWIHRTTNEWLKYFDSVVTEDSAIVQQLHLHTNVFVEDFIIGTVKSSSVNNDLSIDLNSSGSFAYTLFGASSFSGPERLIRSPVSSWAKFVFAGVWSNIANSNSINFYTPVDDNRWYDVYALYQADPVDGNFDLDHFVALPRWEDPNTLSSITDNWSHVAYVCPVLIRNNVVEPFVLTKRGLVFAGEYRQFSGSLALGLGALTQDCLEFVSDSQFVNSDTNYFSHYLRLGGVSERSLLPNGMEGITVLGSPNYIVTVDIIALGGNTTNTFIQSNPAEIEKDVTNFTSEHAMSRYEIAPGQTIYNAELYISQSGTFKMRNFSAGGNGVNIIRMQIRRIELDQRHL